MCCGSPVGLQRRADQAHVDPVVQVGPEPAGHHVELEPRGEVPGGAPDEDIGQPVADVAEDAAVRLSAGAGDRSAAAGDPRRKRDRAVVGRHLDAGHLSAERPALVGEPQLQVAVAPVDAAAQRDRKRPSPMPLARVDVVAGVVRRILGGSPRSFPRRARCPRRSSGCRSRTETRTRARCGSRCRTGSPAPAPAPGCAGPCSAPGSASARCPSARSGR